MNSGIYKITCLANNHFYIGQCQNFSDRQRTHLTALKNNRHHNSRLQYTYNKYGENDLIFEMLETCHTEDLNAREQSYLDLCFDSDLCMNLAKEVSSFRRGIKVSEETRNRMSASKLSVKRIEFTEETKIKMSQVKSGDLNPMYGKKQCEESVLKRSKHYIFLDPNNQTVEIFNLRKFCREHNLDHGHMIKVNKGNQKTHKGWSYCD